MEDEANNIFSEEINIKKTDRCKEVKMERFGGRKGDTELSDTKGKGWMKGRPGEDGRAATLGKGGECPHTFFFFSKPPLLFSLIF